MARIRTVKPEFWQDEDLAACSAHARLLAIALLQLGDANGVFRLVPMQVHAHAFPFESDLNIKSLLEELRGISYITTYRVGGKEYGQVPGFRKHQRLQGNEASSDGYYPTPDMSDTGPEGEESDEELLGNDSVKQEVEQGNRGTGEQYPPCGPPTGDDAPQDDQKANRSAQAREVFDYWAARLGKSGNIKFTADRKRKVEARLREGYTVDELKQAVDGILNSPHHMGENEQGVVYDDLGLICRKGEKTDHFIQLASKSGAAKQQDGGSRAARQAPLGNKYEGVGHV